MNEKQLTTESYKGVRDFYPDEMAIQRYIFDVWSWTAESFGFERYDASILEPSDLYKAKGAENEELVNEQTYTFTDRGDREVTLRPEMTPTVARMVAGKRRELQFPLRWYSIPNLFRYERPQKGRLREHWQLNCDIFGAEHYAADVEIILLATQILLNFGATPEMFEVRINNRETMRRAYQTFGLDEEQILAVTRLNDRKDKITSEEYLATLTNIVNDASLAAEIKNLIENADPGDNLVVASLKELGIENVRIDRSLARGFDYYTGTIFEIFDISGENNRAMLGGGRYDNLTEMFGGEAVSGIGFGMGDVTMRDFLETHNLLPEEVRSIAPHVTLIPMSQEENLFAEKVAQLVRQAGYSAAADIGTKKVGDKIARAGKKGSKFVCVIGEDEVHSHNLTIKNLTTGESQSGSVDEIANLLIEE